MSKDNNDFYEKIRKINEQNGLSSDSIDWRYDPMAQSQSVSNETVPPEEQIEWGYWPLWILTGTILGGVLFLFIPFISILMMPLAGNIVGFMPWLASRWKTSRSGWREWNAIHILLSEIGLIVLVVLGSRARLVFGHLGYSFVLSMFLITGIVSLLIAATGRWACRRWLSHTAYGWVWIITGVANVAVLLIGMLALGFLALASFPP